VVPRSSGGFSPTTATTTRISWSRRFPSPSGEAGDVHSQCESNNPAQSPVREHDDLLFTSTTMPSGLTGLRHTNPARRVAHRLPSITKRGRRQSDFLLITRQTTDDLLRLPTTSNRDWLRGTLVADGSGGAQGLRVQSTATTATGKPDPSATGRTLAGTAVPTTGPYYVL